MIKKYILFFFLLVSISNSFSQTMQTDSLSVVSKISIITSGPGEAIYEKFGHTAIRLKDPAKGLDVIYNYGIFDFDNPNFELNFIKGYMQYKLVRYPFYLALKSSQQEQRWVKEQVLNLTYQQKNAFFQFLETNATPENASYFYDPFFDNCATKPRDIIQQIVGTNLVLKDDFITKDSSIRELMNSEMHPNTWGSLGINIALGSKLDKIATTNEHLYLPDYVYKALNSAKVIKNGKEENFITKEQVLLDFEEKTSKSDRFSPFLIILIISVIGLFITYKDYKNNKRTKILDFLIFFVTGIFGVLILFLWFFTNHSTAPNNFNFLWAFAPNLAIAFLLLKNNTPKWIIKYSQLLIALLILIPFIWILKIQLFTYPLAPLFLLLMVRYWFLQKTLKR